MAPETDFRHFVAFLRERRWIPLLGYVLFTGMMTIYYYPELFHALITTGQMVAIVENNVECYNQAIAILIEQE